MNSSKVDLRNKLLAARVKLSSKEVQKRSRKIGNLLKNIDVMNTAKRIGVYLPVKNEVETKGLMNRSTGKTFYIPKRLKDGAKYRFAKFEGWDNLEAGQYGIMQPLGDKFIDVNLLDAIFVPGVAFDKKGVRLGYGAGVYDRLLTKYKGLIAGLAYNFQVLDALPHDKHDVLLHYLVTEEKIYKF